MIPARMQPVLDEVGPLAEALVGAGHRAYLVGGIVRDQLLGRELGPGADIDLTTDATPEQIKAAIGPVADALWTQGERFGTIGAKVGGRAFEITTHRAEAYAPDSRKPTVAFGTDVGADLARRDFTVNAMALEVGAGAPELVDPHGGAADLHARVLRTPLSPEESFADDPLRMLRAARFLAGYGLEPVPELVVAVRELAHRLEIVSAERIRDELDKLLVVEDPSAGLWFVVDTGLAEQFLPELPAMRLEQDPIHHHKDVLAHTIAVVAKTQPERLVRLAALLHDVGKPKTRSFGDNGVTFHHHEVVGARMARDRMQALKYSNEDVEAVRTLVYLHLRFHGYGDDRWSDAAVRRFVRDAGDQYERLVDLTASDCTTRNRRKAEQLARRMVDFQARVAELRQQEALDAIRPDLDGRQVMEHLGLGPGPHVGRALAHLLELRLEEGPLGHDEAIRRLDDWWADQGPEA
ncbi:MAG: CCA tRNA nucleotidyltransferase [Acidimicrobiales bacterium]|nr:CCA tRNA nucleotidyltransferase [Acidimicrobiales bacterium]